MKILGAGWVADKAYGAVFRGLTEKDVPVRTLHRRLAEAGILPGSVEKAGRFDSATRRAFCAAALALHDAGEPVGPVAVIGTGSTECMTANWNYFEDYAKYGRKLARANLFIYTLPTSPLAEVAIHFKLDGPLFYTRPLSGFYPHLVQTAQGLIADGQGASVLALWAEEDAAVAMLFGSSGRMDPIADAQSPMQLIQFLEEKE